MSVRISESYVQTEPRYASMRREVEARRRQAASAVTLAIGAMVFAAVFALALYLLS